MHFSAKYKNSFFNILSHDVGWYSFLKSWISVCTCMPLLILWFWKKHTRALFELLFGLWSPCIQDIICDKGTRFFRIRDLFCEAFKILICRWVSFKSFENNNFSFKMLFQNRRKILYKRIPVLGNWKRNFPCLVCYFLCIWIPYVLKNNIVLDVKVLSNMMRKIPKSWTHQLHLRSQMSHFFVDNSDLKIKKWC